MTSVVGSMTIVVIAEMVTESEAMAEQATRIGPGPQSMTNG